MRISSDSWFKLQGAQTEGFISSVLRSDDGGFGFSGYDAAPFAGTDAGGYRADVSLGLGDFMHRAQGRLTMYTQSLDAGYSAPGLQTLTDAENYGGTFQMPMTERLVVTREVRPPRRGARAHGQRARAQRCVRAHRQLGRGRRRARRRASRRRRPWFR